MILLLLSLFSSTVYGCENISPCFMIEDRNELKMEHIYFKESIESPSNQRNTLAKQILPYIGIPYLYGGENEQGIDCSAFTRLIFKEYGIFLPRTSRSQYRDDRLFDISMEEIEEGDLIFFKKSKQAEISHVAIYVGHGLIAHSSRKLNGVNFSRFSNDSYWRDIAFKAKRFKGEL